MRRILLLLTGLAFLVWGRSILADSVAAPAVVLRDGLLLVLLGLVIFAINARVPAGTPETPTATTQLIPRKMLVWVGWAAALSGSVWLAVALAGNASSSGLVLPLLLWLAAMAIGLISLYRPQHRPASSAPDVWSVEAARQYLQRRAVGHQQTTHTWLPLEKRTIVLSLLLLILVGLLLRIWNFAGLPDGCLPHECDAILAAADFTRTGDLSGLLAGPSPLFTLAASLFLALLGLSTTSTLLLGLLLGVVSIILFYYAATRFVSPAAALLGTLLIACSSLHIVWSRHPSPALLLVLLVTAQLALRPGPGQSQTPGRWAATGSLAGLTLFAAPAPLTWLLLLWSILTPPRQRSNQLFYYWALISVALPRLTLELGASLFNGASLTGFFTQAGSLAAQLLVDGGYLPALLVVLGAAYLLRHFRWTQGWLWSTGFLLVGLPIFATNQPTDPFLLSPLLAFLLIGGVVAIDQFVGEFAQVWASVVSPRRVWTAAAGLILVMLVIGGAARLDSLAERAGDTMDGSYAAIGDYLQQRFADSVDDGGEDATLILVPQAVLDSPSTQLAARGALDRFSHVVPLDPVVHLPFTGPPFIEQGMGDLLYLVPGWDTDLSAYLSALYPGLVAEPINDSNGHTWARAFSVTRSMAVNAQGLPVLYYAGDEIGGLQEATESRREGPLDLPWDTEPPIPTPFVMTGQGMLYIPEAGIYGFRIQIRATSRARLEVAMPPPSALALDTAAGIDEVVVDLPQGFFPLNITIHTGDEVSRTLIEWKRPGAAWEPIPRQALYRAAPDMGAGLLARYYGYTEDENQPQGFDNLAGAPLVGWRVEPWLAANGLMAVSRAVVWQAKLAAPVEGNYAFALAGVGAHQLEIDGILLLNSDSGQATNTSLLLSQGWHDLTLRYRPSGSGDNIQLLWQPPGTNMGRVPYGYLVPLPAETSTEELALPPLPAQEVQPALSEDMPVTGPETSAELQPSSATGLPTDLPDLPFALMWQVGSCGTDIEQFQQPRGVVLNLYNELVYVADQGNRRVILLDLRDGGLVDFYSDEAFEEPFDLDVNPLGQVFMLDAVSQTIYRFEEPEGIAVAQPSETAFYRPRGLGLSLDGNIFVADTGGARVVKLNSADGTVALQVGGPDSPLGQGQPVDVMVLPTGAIYATTAQDGMLWRLDTGESWPAVAPANTFDAPHLAGLTTSSFFVSDPERRLVTYYDESGNPLGQLHSELFAKPVGISALILDEQVYLAVSDSATCQVSLWRAPLDSLPQSAQQ